jgi:hypothetical protein
MPMTADDPLLPSPDSSAWINPLDNTGDGLEGATSEVIDYFEASTIVFPARDRQGQLAPPPDEHVLDYLARSHSLVDEIEALARPSAGTVCVLDTLPLCDLCHREEARYDTYVVRDGHRTGCFLGPNCFADRGENRLGTGQAVYMMTYAEVSPEVRRVCDVLCRRYGQPSLWP